MANANLVLGTDTSLQTIDKLKQGVNLSVMNGNTIHRDWTDDFEDFFAYNSKIKMMDSSMYKMSDTLTIPDPIEQG
jgi:hypothetical protein